MCILVIPQRRSQHFWSLSSPPLQDPHWFPIEPFFSKAPSTPATWPCAASPPLPSPPPASLPSYNSPDRSAPLNTSVGVIQRLRGLGALVSRWCQRDSRRLRAVLWKTVRPAGERVWTDEGSPSRDAFTCHQCSFTTAEFFLFLASRAADTHNINHNTPMWEQ